MSKVKRETCICVIEVNSEEFSKFKKSYNITAINGESGRKSRYKFVPVKNSFEVTGFYGDSVSIKGKLITIT